MDLLLGLNLPKKEKPPESSRMERQPDEPPQVKRLDAHVRPGGQVHWPGLSIGDLSLSSQKWAELVPGPAARQFTYLISRLGHRRKKDRHQARLIPKDPPQVGPLTKRSIE